MDTIDNSLLFSTITAFLLVLIWAAISIYAWKNRSAKLFASSGALLVIWGVALQFVFHGFFDPEVEISKELVSHINEGFFGREISKLEKMNASQEIDILRLETETIVIQVVLAKIQMQNEILDFSETELLQMESVVESNFAHLNSLNEIEERLNEIVEGTTAGDVEYSEIRSDILANNAVIERDYIRNSRRLSLFEFFMLCIGSIQWAYGEVIVEKFRKRVES